MVIYVDKIDDVNLDTLLESLNAKKQRVPERIDSVKDGVAIAIESTKISKPVVNLIVNVSLLFWNNLVKLKPLGLPDQL